MTYGHEFAYYLITGSGYGAVWLGASFMFSRRSLFAALGLALPLVAAASAEAATPRTTAPKRPGRETAAARPRRSSTATKPPAKG